MRHKILESLAPDVRAAALEEAAEWYSQQYPGRWSPEQLDRLAEADVAYTLSGGVDVSCILQKWAKRAQQKQGGGG